MRAFEDKGMEPTECETRGAAVWDLLLEDYLWVLFGRVSEKSSFLLAPPKLKLSLFS